MRFDRDTQLIYFEYNKQALACIREWLIDTGAIAGKKTNKSEFVANWQQASLPENKHIIFWYTNNRGRAFSYVSYSRSDEDQIDHEEVFRSLIVRLNIDNPIYGSLQRNLQTMFSYEVNAYHLQQELIKKAADAFQKRRKEQAEIAFSAIPFLNQERDCINRMLAESKNRISAYNTQCHNTFNEHMCMKRIWI